jgi:hypothetical protein
MKDFTIRPSIDRDVVHVLETMKPSSAPAIASLLPLDQFDPLPYSLGCSPETSSDDLVCFGQYFDTSGD